MTELLLTDIKSILNLLLLQLTSHYRRVLAAIRLLAKMNQNSAVYDTDEKIVRLCPYTVLCYYTHMYVWIVGKLRMKVIALSIYSLAWIPGSSSPWHCSLLQHCGSKRKWKGKASKYEKGIHSHYCISSFLSQAIGSLTELMKLMGPKHITNVRMKIMAVLRYYLSASLNYWLISCVYRHCLTFSDPNIMLLTLQAWKCFINWLVFSLCMNIGDIVLLTQLHISIVILTPLFMPMLEAKSQVVLGCSVHSCSSYSFL